MESVDTPDPMLGKRPPWKPEALQREREGERRETRGEEDTRGLGREPGKS